MNLLVQGEAVAMAEAEMVEAEMVAVTEMVVATTTGMGVVPARS